MKKAPFIPGWLDDLDLSPTEFRVFCRILRRGKCWESVLRMAVNLGMSKDTVRREIGTLKERGLITVIKQGKGKPNLIKPNLNQGHPLTLDRVTPPNPNQGHKGTPTKGSPFKESKNKIRKG